MIFISLENWDDVWRRNQFLCAELLRRFPGMRLLFVERTRDLTHALRKRSLEPLRTEPFRTLPAFPGLALFRALKCLPNSLAPCRALNALYLRRQILAAARWTRLRHPLLWINDHFAHSMVGTLGESGVVYDITDDWGLMPSIPEAERARIRLADGALCAKADLVVVCSKALEASRAAVSRKLVRVSNGVDTSLYPTSESACASFPHTARAESARNASPAAPVFGYAGTLHGDRLDLDLLDAMARRLPHARIVLCGPNLLTPAERAKLAAHPNIAVLPQVPFTEVPALLAQWDVVFLPHRCSPFTESLNPIKLWEYLASGKPIAATPVAGFRDFPHLCHLGAGEQGFLEACRRALCEEPGLASLRQKEAAQHSWSNRATQLLEQFARLGWLTPPQTGPEAPRPHHAEIAASRLPRVRRQGRAQSRKRHHAPSVHAYGRVHRTPISHALEEAGT